MKFDIFCEIQRAFPWHGQDEASLLRETLAQARRPTPPVSTPGIWKASP